MRPLECIRLFLTRIVQPPNCQGQEATPAPVGYSAQDCARQDLIRADST